MFFSEDILVKQRGGDLALLWIAATATGGTKSRLLRKKEILTCALPQACQSLITPQEPMALRLMASLLLGLTRIYAHQIESLTLQVTQLNLALKRTMFEDLQANLILNNPTAHPRHPKAIKGSDHLDITKYKGLNRDRLIALNANKTPATTLPKRYEQPLIEYALERGLGAGPFAIDVITSYNDRAYDAALQEVDESNHTSLFDLPSDELVQHHHDKLAPAASVLYEASVAFSSSFSRYSATASAQASFDLGEDGEDGQVWYEPERSLLQTNRTAPMSRTSARIDIQQTPSSIELGRGREGSLSLSFPRGHTKARSSSILGSNTRTQAASFDFEFEFDPEQGILGGFSPRLDAALRAAGDNLGRPPQERDVSIVEGVGDETGVFRLGTPSGSVRGYEPDEDLGPAIPFEDGAYESPRIWERASRTQPLTPDRRSGSPSSSNVMNGKRHRSEDDLMASDHAPKIKRARARRPVDLLDSEISLGDAVLNSTRSRYLTDMQAQRTYSAAKKSERDAKDCAEALVMMPMAGMKAVALQNFLVAPCDSAIRARLLEARGHYIAHVPAIKHSHRHTHVGAGAVREDGQIDYDDPSWLDPFGDQGGAHDQQADYELQDEWPEVETGRQAQVERPPSRVQSTMPWNRLDASIIEEDYPARPSSALSRRFSLEPAGRMSLPRRRSDATVTSHSHPPSPPLDAGYAPPLDESFEGFKQGFQPDISSDISSKQDSANFLTYLTLLSTKEDDLLLSDVAPVISTKPRVAAQAFYHILTFASQGVIDVSQSQDKEIHIALRSRS
ncbi:hypothetical protein E5Q_06125 [Mixia osmundae IAM 14324]|uniref:Rad21/Rec8-like protein N-terminal domain-containing protein n=1 Tax=Mixia osmundae (strain CBS 9802 / IAM 14324 / JCM 22182 / KY 12970) TaxID=764103 RepID=G7E9V8_MIXOS|nr:hypothetical protein E5Q_06125 [Mixia osmundae IAM 14324]